VAVKRGKFFHCPSHIPCHFGNQFCHYDYLPLLFIKRQARQLLLKRLTRLAVLE
jgi:Zn-finger protein